MTKILLIDDDVELVGLLKEYLEHEGFEVGTAHDGEQAVPKCLSGDYALAILDVMIPKLSGVEILRRVRESSRMPILMLTAKDEDMDRIVGLELGADDYVPKPCSPRELTARIRAILRRGQPETSETLVILAVGHLKMWPEQRRAEWAGAVLELTSTEFNLLAVLARNAGRPVSKTELAEQGLGRQLARFDRSIDVHLSSIRRKLDALSPATNCIRTVFRRGYQLIRE